MAASMQQTKSRIRSVSSTRKITKAMELVATSKLKKAKDLHFKVTPFADEVVDIMSYCATNVSDKKYRFFNENETNKKLYIIVASSLGLCGGYNVNTFKYASAIIDKQNDDLIIIGSKAKNYFESRNYHIIASYELPSIEIKENISSLIAFSILDKFSNQEYKNINMIHTKFINSLTFEPTIDVLLPITPQESSIKTNKELLLEPSAEEVLDNLIPFYLSTTIKSLMFESILSEQASRRTAMETATDNADELQDKLQLEFNKSRQASITQEITEISGAANANK